MVSVAAAAVCNGGRLKGLTILRFAHTCGDGGGLERYLLDLNRALGERNQLTTIQVELSYDRHRLAEQTEIYNGCRLIKIPLFAELAPQTTDTAKSHNGWLIKLKDRFVEQVLCSWPVYQVFTRNYLKRRQVPRRSGEPDGAGLKVQEIIKQYKVDLIVLHSSGGADASEIIEQATAARVPVALVYHFSNDRLAGLSLRQQISRIAGVAGVCAVEVPHYLSGRFWNLSDGIDTEFYRPENARPLSRQISAPILLLPARITPSKGQADLLKVAAGLKRRGIRTTVVFAGRVDSPAFENELRQIAIDEELAGDVEFVGQLDPEQLRDWYAAAAVMVFPTRHHEGLGRVSVEAQAMGLPPVVYAIGGTPESILHRKTGFLVPLGDVQGMTNAVETLLRDDSLRAVMSQAGRRFAAEKFSLSALAERHEDYYLKILSGQRPRQAVN